MIPSSSVWLERLVIAGGAWDQVAAWGQAAVMVETEDWGKEICGIFFNLKSLWLDYDLAKEAKVLLIVLYFFLPVDLEVFAMLGKRDLCVVEGRRSGQRQLLIILEPVLFYVDSMLKWKNSALSEFFEQFFDDLLKKTPNLLKQELLYFLW